MKKKYAGEHYTHIKKIERLEIAILLNKGYSIRDIAKVLHRNPGSISREIKKNSIKGIYDPHKADHKAYVKRKYSKYQGMKVEKDIQLRKYIEEKITKEDWSPEQIAGRLKEIDTHIKYASYGAIYKFIYSVYGRVLERHLRYKGKKKKRKREKVTKLKDRTFIDKRPEIINNRERFGDWEVDFIVSGKNGKEALVVFHERKARHTMTEKIVSRSPVIVNQQIKKITERTTDEDGPACFNSMTTDNDISFMKHEELSGMINAPIYFCHPYHSWEKGGVENTNKLIRQYIPKGSDISKYNDEYIKEIENKLNNRPRKCLNYKTPLEVMRENNQFKTFPKFQLENFVLQRSKIETNKISPSVALEG